MPHGKSELAMLAGPFALVLALSLSSRFHPQSTNAQPRSFGTPAHDDSKTTVEDNELAEWIAELDIDPDMRSPMDHGPTPEVQVIAPVYVPTTPIAVYENPLLNAKLTSVIGTGDQALVSIDGRLYRMNDEPAPGCRITLIDAKRQTVSVVLPTGDVFLIRVRRP